jgi:colicin import membrane protein
MEPEINPDVRKRIMAAADQLYAQGGEGAIPNVDAVRRTAKVNMNDVSAVMKQWRRALLAKAAPVPLLIPEAVQQACQAGLEHLWRTAQECANQHLRTAQAGWDQERSENDTVCQQLSKAFDEQALLCAEQQRQLQALSDELQTMVGFREADKLARMSCEADRAVAVGRAERAEADASGQEQRAADMKEQLAFVTAALAREQGDLERVRQRSENEVAALRAELAQAQRQASVLERRAALAEALEADVQRQVAALNNELIQARSDLEKGRQAVNEAQTAAAANQGERDIMAANLAQVLAVFKNGESKVLKVPPNGRKSGQPTKSDGDSKR